MPDKKEAGAEVTGRWGEKEEWGMGGEGKCGRESEEQGRQPGRARGGEGVRKRRAGKASEV